MKRHSTTRWLPATLAAVTALLSACTDDPTATMAGEPSGPASSPSQTPLVTTLPDGSRLDPGSYALTAVGGPELPPAVVDVPSGFEAGGGFLFGGGAIGYWSVSGVYKDPCTKQGGLKDVGHTVDELATALASQPMIPATTPVPVSIGGHDGAYLVLTAPHLDYHACDPQDVAFWSTDHGDRFAEAAGRFDRVWILDVEGNIAVLNAAFEPGVSQQDIQALTKVVESAEFPEPHASSSP